MPEIQETEVEGAADGDDRGGKGGRCGWTEAMYEACFRVSLKHASLREFQEIEDAVAADGDDRGGKGGRRGWTEAMYEACFRVSLKHASKHVSGLVSNMFRCGLKYSGN